MISKSLSKGLNLIKEESKMNKIDDDLNISWMIINYFNLMIDNLCNIDAFFIIYKYLVPWEEFIKIKVSIIIYSKND